MKILGNSTCSKILITHATSIIFSFRLVGSSWLVVEVLVNSPGEIVPSLHPKRWSLHLGSTTPEGLCQSKIESAKCRYIYIYKYAMHGWYGIC